MPQGLPRKIRYAFVLQGLRLVLAVVVGVSLLTLLTRDALARRPGEAPACWEQAGGPQGARLPSTGSLQGHFQPAGSGDAAIPPDVESLPEGVNFIYRSHKAVLVQRRPEGALYLVLRTGRVDG